MGPGRSGIYNYIVIKKEGLMHFINSSGRSSFSIIIILLSTLVFIVGAAHAQEGLIKEVRIKNNVAISEATILSKIKTKEGDTFNQDVLNDDLKRLYAMGFFTDVSIDVEEKEAGVVVNIIVEEKPVIESVEFHGNKKMTTRKLRAAIQTREGDMLNYSKLSQDIIELKALYSSHGFQGVSIKYVVDKGKDPNTAVIRIDILEKKRVRIKKVTVEGNEAVKSKHILAMIGTRPAWLLSRGYFDDDMFEADKEKIKRYYQNLGYLDVEVSEDFDYTEDGKLMYITLKIIEGRKYTAGKVILEGKLLFSKEEVAGQIYLKEGDPFSHGKMRRDMDRIREFYYKRGYMNVGVDVKRDIDPATNVIDLVYTIDASEVVYVGKINIKGNTKTKDIVIRRELRVYPGEKYDGDKLKRSKERLYNLGFFEDIYFDTIKTAKPNVRDLDVYVKETKTGEFSFGGGYSSIDAFIGFVQISQRNFDLFNFPNFTGDGQYLVIKASVGSVRQDYEVSWTEPWIFDQPVLFGFDAYRRTHSRESSVGYGYEERRTGGDLRLGKEFTEYVRGDLMYKLEEVSISDLSDDATEDLVKERGDNWISSLMLAFAYDTRDNIFTPKKGVYSQLVLENAGGFLGFDKDFMKGFLQAMYYHTFFEKLVLEIKGRTGLAEAYGGTDDVPIYERFYAGGANTIRGYRERRVGPRDPGSNDPIGGDAMLVGNAELVFPIYEKVIKGAVFYDVGNVWKDIDDYFSLDGGLKQGAGVGVRVKTPIGPLKLDVGYPLSDNQDDKKRLEWYFSVSHGF